jgi:polyvinyl alcohol dehydrogenase (cytochrome)
MIHRALLAAVAALAAAPAVAVADTAATTPAPNPRGEAAYHSVCAQCHEQAIGHAPAPSILRMMSAGAIYKALTEGVMRVPSAGMSDADKRAVAEYLGGAAVARDVGLAPPPCRGRQAAFDYDEPTVFTDWGFDAGNRHDIPARVSGITRANVTSLKLNWALGFPNALRARSQPALAGGALYVGSQDGSVFALDRASGCQRWVYHAAAEVRTGIVVAPWTKGDRAAHPLAYFGDLVGTLYAVDIVTGRLAWSDHPDKHPSTTLTAAPVLVGNHLYVPVSSLEEAAIDPHYVCCTFRGSMVAYDARTGKHLWRTFMTAPATRQGVNAVGAEQYGPSGAALWNTPAVDAKRGLLYVGTGDNYSEPASPMSDAIVALDMKTGAIRWAYQARPGDAWNTACFQAPKGPNCPSQEGPDFDFGAAPILATARDGRDFVLAGQKSGEVYGIDPDKGTLIWKTRVGRGGNHGGVYFGMAVDGDTLFVPVSDSPVSHDDLTYDRPPAPGLYALDLRTGAFKRKAPNNDGACQGRFACDPGLGSAIMTTSGLVFAGSIDGWLRVYDGASGKIVWRFDTARRFKTVGGGEAAGGSMAGAPAPIAFDGALILPSGYDFASKMPGNILLVFQAGAAGRR